MVFERERDGWLVSDDRSLLDVRAWHDFLVRSYWSPGVPLSVVERAAANSLCLGLYERGAGRSRMIGAGRAGGAK